MGRVANEEPVPPLSLDMPGGAEAPRQARTAVLEAEVGVDIEEDCVHIEVSDCGARLRPRATPRHPDAPQALGLALVDQHAQAWGVDRDGAGHTRVWCELPLSRT